MGAATSGLVNAASAGNLILVKQLVQSGASKEAKDERGWTALIMAAYLGHLDIVRYLVMQGADKEAKNNDCSTVLMHAAWSGHLKVVQYLVSKGTDKEVKAKDGETALIRAAGMGHWLVVSYLVKHGAYKDAKGNYGTALMAAAREGHLDVVSYLVKQGANKDAKAKDGSTALMLAAQNGHEDVAKYLVKQGANEDVKNIDGEVEAAGSGHLGIAQYDLKQGADKDAKAKDGSTALMLAAQNGHEDVAQNVVKQGANEDVKNIDGEVEAAGSGHLGIAQYDLKQGADKDAKAKDGSTALMLAAQNGHEDVAQNVVKQGANEDVKNIDGEVEAAGSGHLGIAQYDLKQGADKDAKAKDGSTALMLAAQNGHEDVAQNVVKQGANEDVKNIDGEVEAAGSGHLGIAQYDLKQGADKDAKAEDGETALIKAARAGSLETVEKLVRHGADASCLDNEENSAILLLLQYDGVDKDKVRPIVRLLLECGAPPLKSNKQGEAALSIARNKSFHDIVDLLNEYASKSQPVSAVEAPAWLILPDQITKASKALAEGSSGVVYRANWSNTDVVVKEITMVEMHRFLQEVETWRKLTHNNVVPFFGANHRKEPFFIVSKYASKGKLIPYLKQKKERGQTIVWRKMKEVAAGLCFLHGHNIVHGDLRGDNIVVSEDGTAMLTDFGMSFTESGPCSLKRLEGKLGAMEWRAPEFAKLTNADPTRKSDVYSLGKCIIEAVTGDPPPTEPDRHKIRGLLSKSMTDAQWELVLQMIADSPNDRPDVADVIPALENFAKTENIQAWHQAGGSVGLLLKLFNPRRDKL